MNGALPPVVDAHHHLWDLSLGRQPWLCGGLSIPFRYGDYAAIRRDYLPEHYRGDTAGFDIVKTVYVETEWDPDDPVGETRWLDGVRREAGFPHAMVASAWLDRDDVEDVLGAHAEFDFVRAIRNKPAVVHAPFAPRGEARGSMSDDRWRRGYERLSQVGLSFDLQAPWWHLPEAAQLARDFPDTTIIINHAALPADRSAEGIAAWRDALRVVAAERNVALKLSGLGVPGQAWTAQLQRPVVRSAIELFGVERCMFASNFPVDGLVAGYATIMNSYRQCVSDLPPADQQRLFHDNALKFYRLDR